MSERTPIRGGSHRVEAASPTMSHDLGNASISDALSAAVEDGGGFKTVGCWLRPELHPETAGRWLAHCVSGRKRDKLSLDQIAAIFRRAHQRGAHRGAARLNLSIGYAPPAPLLEADVIADLNRQAIALAQRATDLSHEAMERMRAAHLNVEALSE